MTEFLHCTLCFVISPDNRCLMLKRVKEPHKGKWNAPGGKLLPGESPVQGARRELMEETGLNPELLPLGFIDCGEESGMVWRLHLFMAKHPKVPVAPSPEGQMEWLSLGEILRGGSEVVHNIPLVLPLLLMGQWIQGRFNYKGDFLTDYRISLHDKGKGLEI